MKAILLLRIKMAHRRGGVRHNPQPVNRAGASSAEKGSLGRLNCRYVAQPDMARKLSERGFGHFGRSDGIAP